MGERGNQGRLRYLLQGREEIVLFPKKKICPISVDGLFSIPPPPDSVSAESFRKGFSISPKVRSTMSYIFHLSIEL